MVCSLFIQFTICIYINCTFDINIYNNNPFFCCINHSLLIVGLVLSIVNPILYFLLQLTPSKFFKYILLMKHSKPLVTSGTMGLLVSNSELQIKEFILLAGDVCGIGWELRHTDCVDIETFLAYLHKMVEGYKSKPSLESSSSCERVTTLLLGGYGYGSNIFYMFSSTHQNDFLKHF